MLISVVTGTSLLQLKILTWQSLALDSLSSTRMLLVGTVPKPSVRTPVQSTHALEDFSEPQDQDTEGWITVKNSRKKAVTFL
jgi:hypothetical protein